MNASTDLRHALRQLDGDLRYNEALTRYGTYRIGGPAAAVLRPASIDEVAKAVRLCLEYDIPYLPIGLGSNVLFDDEGFAGLVIRLAASTHEPKREGPDGSQWTVAAGLPIPRLARASATVGHQGLQRLIGVPGAVGGGVFMNAGAHGQDFSQVVASVSVVTGQGEIASLSHRDIAWQYRSSGIEGIVVDTTLQLEPADPAVVRRELVECLKRRKAGTPFDQPCCGSVFRNPSADEVAHLSLPEPRTAGRLIEAVDLKGAREGAAQVSPVHANYVVNTGGATAAEVKRLIARIEERVHERFGVRLRREVKFVGTTGMERSETA